ncbi:MAG: DUF512 domain-containing protein [Clostridia bacterium]|nr:DUF512 domain-containing protein [Clostridia bacterium]
MAVVIKNVNPDSLCGKKGITAGYVLLSVNGHEINDVLDYRFYANSKRINISFQAPDGEVVTHRLKNELNPEVLGLEFETYLMDKHHSCKNKCIFCFIDQMPHGMRKSLYFKDDDSRLSFLFGNYVTLTNMSESDIDRIIEMHISPVNISVHTMNPELRVQMMKNPNSGKVLSYINKLADAGIEINAQLVLCPGYNDGEELLYSLNELAKIGKSIVSVAAVPVGLTKHREGLCELKGYDKNSAAEVIDMINDFNFYHYNEFGRNFCYAADEFYLKAERRIPDYEYYDDFRQLDNGVGMWRETESLFLEALDEIKDCSERKVVIITGVAATGLMNELAETFKKKFPEKIVDVFTVVNDFFGHSVTVAGLVTATDIINQVKDLSLYDVAFIPDVMLKSSDEQIFLDDISLEEVSEKLNVKIIPVGSSGAELLYHIM